MNSTIDQIDRKILTVLAENGRESVTAVAERVGLSKSPCAQRIRRLEKDGYIKGYQARIDQKRLGRAHIAFAEVKLTSTRDSALHEFNQAVLAIPEIEQCHMIAGGFDYLLKVRSESIEDYRRILGEKISTLPHVAQTSTYVAMETVKD